jgi:hypothetical protein
VLGNWTFGKGRAYSRKTAANYLPPQSGRRAPPRATSRLYWRSSSRTEVATATWPLWWATISRFPISTTSAVRTGRSARPCAKTA